MKAKGLGQHARNRMHELTHSRVNKRGSTGRRQFMTSFYRKESTSSLPVGLYDRSVSHLDRFQGPFAFVAHLVRNLHKNDYLLLFLFSNLEIEHQPALRGHGASQSCRIGFKQPWQLSPCDRPVQAMPEECPGLTGSRYGGKNTPSVLLFFAGWSASLSRIATRLSRSEGNRLHVTKSFQLAIRWFAFWTKGTICVDFQHSYTYSECSGIISFTVLRWLRSLDLVVHIQRFWKVALPRQKLSGKQKRGKCQWQFQLAECRLQNTAGAKRDPSDRVWENGI